MYYRIKPSIYEDFGVQDEPPMPFRVSFKSGQPITVTLPTPLTFMTDNTAAHPPLHFVGINIPVMSKALGDVLLGAGVDNIDTYDALLENSDTGERWSDYLAVNILSLVACADLSRSDYTHITERPSGLPLATFHTLVIDAARTHDLAMFRLAESPSQILVHERIIDALTARASLATWGISEFPVAQS